MKSFFIKKIENTLLNILAKNNQSIKREINNNQILQKQLFAFYQSLKNDRKKLPIFKNTGFRVFSQNDEDGLFLYIFALIGFTNKICIDIAFGSPYGANVTNLICNWDFTGLLIEGKNTEDSINFFGTHPDTWIYPPKIIKAWVTKDNVNQLIKDNGIVGEIDLFSLDLDGIDYWILKNLNVVSPRVIILEYMNIFGPNIAVTVPYKSDFDRSNIHPDFFGASLGAFVKLGKKKGYRLVGCNKYGFNAFFMRNDLGKKEFPEVSISSCLNHPVVLEGRKNRLPAVKNLGWIAV
ncbi:hypothetical protein A3D77_07395 [Candidatus Gottesmanbacteria bacterium RIFCSPHIGHO2_02_FULL_39_11]|uniref:Methyltransferase FkbM domain-containing protein n=1 Tax=Candidatus Gottesmanbacteria bacterium RIFCSPHIGHO2_02_FULL_39_11 TaxID=1798382 RepID=A0A1F5ZKF9_9BACT|nr:MAG: hypothetical protein A3D77_07395 [Candidatus Gottesmanbacteria bacterium RIFCSPHIGHO2_02_FULL_39_11]